MKELAAATFLRIVQEAIDIGYKKIVITGGEPLKYYAFNDFLSGLEKIDKKKSLFVLRSSFGFVIEDALLKKLCRTFDEIVVSLDGDEEIHDAARGKGTFQTVTENIKKAKKIGAHISVNAVMDREQLEKYPGTFLKNYSKELGIDRLTIQSPVPLGRAQSTSVPYYEWQSDYVKPDSVPIRFSCALGHSLYIQPDGSTYPCYGWCEKENQLGDLSKESLKNIFERGELLRIINSGVDTNEKCRSCEVRYFCGGQCKIWVRNKVDINSGDFDCTEKKQKILQMLERYGIISAKRQRISADENGLYQG